MKALLAGLSLLGVVSSSTVSSPAAEQAASPFSIVIEQLPNGWAARCENGCQWPEASFTCASACSAIVDNSGLVTLATMRPDQAAFRFILEPRGHEVFARAQVGTAWKTLSWACAHEPCRVRVSESGVGVAPPAR